MTCPNCGRQATGNFCPGCGTRLSAQPAPEPGIGQGRPSHRRRAQNRNDRQSLEYPQNREHVYRQINAQQSFRQDSVPGQYAFPGYVPSQGYNPGRQETGVYQDIPAWAAGQSPGGQLLMRLAGSPIMLICAILASLYALSMCYLCGKEIVHLIGEIGDHYKYYSTAQKIANIISIVTAFAHAIMAAWLLAAVWRLIGSAVGRHRLAMRCSGLQFCKSYTRIRGLLLFLPAFAAMLSLAMDIVEVETNSFSYGTLSLTLSCATHAGFQAVTVLFTKHTTLTLAFLSGLLLLAAARSSLLTTVCATSVRMLRYGGPQQRRVVPAAVLTLLRGLVLLAGGIYMLAEYGDHFQFDGILQISSFLVTGLASCLLSVLLFRDAAGIRRLQGE